MRNIGRHPRSEFLSLILLQILSSTFIIIPVIATIKLLPGSDTEIVAYFSFASTLSIGFTKSVLVTSHSLSQNIEGTISRNMRSDLKVGAVLVTLQFLLSVILLSSSFLLLLFLHVGLFGMLKIEYRSQMRVIAQKWKSVYLTYILSISAFLSFTFIAIELKSLTPATIIGAWALSTVLIALSLTLYDHKKIQENPISLSVKSKNRTLLGMDFLLNYGLMQLLYSFAMNITSSDEMLKYRLLLFLSIPTNIAMQILSTSGLRFIFKDTQQRKKKLELFYISTFTPTFFLVIAVGLLGPDLLGIYLGEIWKEIPALLPAFLAMSITSIFLTHSSMTVKWANLTQVVFARRVFLSVMQFLVTSFAISWNGALGILPGLIVFNVIFMLINLIAIRSSKRSS